MKHVLLVILLVSFKAMFSQPNCNIYSGECLKACEIYARSEMYNQGSIRAQDLFDSAIAICPSFAYAHHEKSVAFLKNGEFIVWRKYIDEAVKYNPIQFLGNRGWCRFKFIHDYAGGLKDLKQLQRINGGFLGWSTDGDYDLRIVKALCYRELGQLDSALFEFEAYFVEKDNKVGLSVGSYDYLHYGVTLMKAGKIEEALSALVKQLGVYKQLPDTYYHLAQVYLQGNNKVKAAEHLNQAKQYYLQGYARLDPYCEPLDKVFLSTIEEELTKFEGE